MVDFEQVNADWETYLQQNSMGNICWEYWSYNVGECSVFERIYNYKSLNVDESLWLRGSRHF